MSSAFLLGKKPRMSIKQLIPSSDHSTLAPNIDIKEVSDETKQKDLEPAFLSILSEFK